MKFKPKALRNPQLRAALDVTAQARDLVETAAEVAVSAPEADDPPPGGRPPRRYKKLSPRGAYSLWDGSNHRPGDVVAMLTDDFSSAPRGRRPLYVVPAKDAFDPYAWAAAGYSYSGPVICPEDEPDPDKRRAFALKVGSYLRELDEEQKLEENAAWTAYRRVGMPGYDLDLRGATLEVAMAYAGKIVAWEAARGVEVRVSHSGNGLHVEWGLSREIAHPNLFRIFGARRRRMVEEIGEAPEGLFFDPAPLTSHPDSRGRLWRIAGGLCKDGSSRKRLVAGVAHPDPITRDQLAEEIALVDKQADRARRRRARARREAAEVQGSFRVVNREALGPFAKVVQSHWDANRPRTGPERHDARLAIAGVLQVLGFPEADVARIVNDATGTTNPRDGRQLAATTRARFLSEGEPGIRGSDWLERRWGVDLRTELAQAMPQAETKEASAPARPWDRIGFMSRRLKRRALAYARTLLSLNEQDGSAKHLRETATCGAIQERQDCGTCNGVVGYAQMRCKRPLCAACWPSLVGGFFEAVASEDYARSWPKEVYVATTHVFGDYQDLSEACAKSVGKISGVRWRHHYELVVQNPDPQQDLKPQVGVRFLLVVDPKLASGGGSLGWLRGTVGPPEQDRGNRPVATEWALVPREKAWEMVAMAQLSHHTARARCLRRGWLAELAESVHATNRRTFAAGTRDFARWPARQDAEAQVIAAAEARRNEIEEEVPLPQGRHECPGCSGGRRYCLLFGHAPVEERPVIHRSDYPHSIGQAIRLSVEHARAESTPDRPLVWSPFPPEDPARPPEPPG